MELILILADKIKGTKRKSQKFAWQKEIYYFYWVITIFKWKELAKVTQPLISESQKERNVLCPYTCISLRTQFPAKLTTLRLQSKENSSN
jgi:hypothetical protein